MFNKTVNFTEYFEKDTGFTDWELNPYLKNTKQWDYDI
jgi:hypothetical protein